MGPHRNDLAARHVAKRADAKDCSTGEQKALLISIMLADARELGMLFRDLDAAKQAGDAVNTHRLLHKIDAFQTHVVPGHLADVKAAGDRTEANFGLERDPPAGVTTEVYLSRNCEECPRYADISDVQF